MKSAYSRYSESPSPFLREGIGLPRPEVVIRVTGVADSVRVRGLVDTGAEVTLVPRRLADLIGAVVEPGESTSVIGFAGHQVEIVTGRVDWQLGEGEKALRWTSRVGFATFADPSDEEIILGHAGFLEFFRATFDGPSAMLELTPSDGFPGPSTGSGG